MTKATWTKPFRVPTSEKSLTQSMSGAGTRNWRLPLSGGHGWFSSGIVVPCGLPQMFP